MIRQVEKKDVERQVLVLDCAHEVNFAIGRAELKEVLEPFFCDQCVQLNFPKNVNHYLDSKVFNQDTVPKGLLRAHSTKDKTWGKIIVKSGELMYVVDDLGDQSFLLQAGVEGVIAPKMLHHIERTGAVEFFIEFYATDK